MSSLFVLADEFVQLVAVDDDVQRADLGQSELLRVDEVQVDFLPCLDAVGLPSGLDGR